MGPAIRAHHLAERMSSMAPEEGWPAVLAGETGRRRAAGGVGAKPRRELRTSSKLAGVVRPVGGASIVATTTGRHSKR